jgi:hypothetical protein
MIYRQGDVLLKETKFVGGDLTGQGESLVLAEGESTGHRHLLSSPEPISVFDVPSTERRFIWLTRPATLTHEEHKQLVIGEGTYEVIRERSYDYAHAEPRTDPD